MATSPWKTVRNGTRVGLKSQPLRLPGQSTDERIRQLQDHWGELLILPACTSVVAILEWLHWINVLPLNPWIPTMAAILSIGYAAVRFRPLITHIRRLRQGRHGERCVGEILDGLREKGYRVFRDVPGHQFNIDHVIVGSAGIFAIETKARTKVNGARNVVYDGNTLRIEGGQPFDEPLNQARDYARWLAELINDGRRAIEFQVRPVVVFPEWYVSTSESQTKSDVWVANPKQLEYLLGKEPAVLSSEQIDAVAHSLVRHCREQESGTGY